MKFFAISGDQIQTTKIAFMGFKPAIKVEYNPAQIKAVFNTQKDMFVFDSLENAKLYALIKRFETDPHSEEEKCAFKQHLVFEVELPDSFDLSSYPAKIEIEEALYSSVFEKLGLKKNDKGYDCPKYHLVPANLVTKVISAIDGLDKQYDLVAPPTVESSCMPF